MKKLFAAALLIAAVLCAGCGGDKKVVVEDGHQVIDLPPGEKLVNFAASRYEEFVIHRKRQVNESPEEYTVDMIDASDDIHSARYIIRER